jgi:hypothetical protein
MATTVLAEPDHLARTATQALTNARRVGELATAAVAVIDQRTRQIGAAVGDPVALAAPEFTRMVSEKLEAAALAGRALQRGLPATVRVAQAWLEQQGTVLGRATTTLWQARSPADLVTLGPRAVLAGVDAHGRWMATMLHLGTQLFGAGLAPIHRPATRNARRLARQA